MASADGPPSPPVIDVPAGDVDTTASSLSVEGTGEPSYLVAVTIGPDEVCDTVVSLSGSWSCTVDLLALGDLDAVALQATQTMPNPPSLTSSPSGGLLVTSHPFPTPTPTPTPGPPPPPPPLPAPAVDPFTLMSTSSPLPVDFGGTVANPGGTIEFVHVYDGMTLLCAAPVVGSPMGTWACSALVDGAGEHSITARSRDMFGVLGPPSPPQIFFLTGPPGPPSPPAPDTGSSGDGTGSRDSAEDESSGGFSFFAFRGPGGTSQQATAGESEVAAAPPALSVTPTPTPRATPGPRALAPSDGRPGDPTTTASGSGSSGGSAFGTGAADPSEFGSTLRTFRDVAGIDPLALAALVGGFLVFLLLLAIPSTLLESTLEENSERLPRWLRLWSRQARGAVPLAEGEKKERGEGRLLSPGFWLSALGLIVAAAILSGFVDQGFGFGIQGLRIVIALFVGLLILNAAALLAMWIGAGRSGRPSLTITLRPATLILLAITVLLSRLLDLQPGVLFGLLVGVGLGAELAKARQARVALVGSAVTLALGALGWVGYNVLAGADPTFLSLLGSEISTSLVVEALTALVVALLPIAFLDGKAIWSWSRIVWFVSYAIAVAAFVFLLLPIPESWVDVPSLSAPWVVASAAYALLSIAVWAYFRYRPDRPRHRSTRAISKAID